jgi:lipopolysaccharide export system permease protein
MESHKSSWHEKGRMAKTDDNKYLVLQLVNGVRYEEAASSSGSAII